LGGVKKKLCEIEKMISLIPPPPKCDYNLKAIVIGDASTGKSSLLKVAGGEVFDEDLAPTIAMEFKTTYACGKRPPQSALLRESMGEYLAHDPCVEDTVYRVQLWDCAGQERFRSIITSYFRDAHIVFLVYDVTSHQSFEHVASEWQKQLDRALVLPLPVLVLVSNKCDLEDAREISHINGEVMAQSVGAHYFIEVSAKTGHNVEEMLLKALEKIHERVISGELRLQHTSILKSRRNGLNVVDSDQAQSGCFGGGGSCSLS
jgi:Ras-related protein Rab-6A